MTADDMPKVPLLGKEARLMKGVVDNATRPSGEFIFELWADGHPADPEKYVIFQ